METDRLVICTLRLSESNKRRIEKLSLALAANGRRANFNHTLRLIIDSIDEKAFLAAHTPSAPSQAA